VLCQKRAMLMFMAIGVALTALAHMWPAPFVIDWMAGERAVWSMPRTGVPTVYLTFDDGPNPSTTPDLLDVLAAERTSAFLPRVTTQASLR